MGNLSDRVKMTRSRELNAQGIKPDDISNIVGIRHASNYRDLTLGEWNI